MWWLPRAPRACSSRVCVLPFLPQAGRTPVKVINGVAFLYIKVGNMYAVAVSQGNAQAAVAFQFLYEVVKVLKNYFGDFTEESIRNNFVLICARTPPALQTHHPHPSTAGCGHHTTTTTTSLPRHPHA